MNPKYSEFMVPFFSSSDVIFCTPLSMLAINMFCTCFQGKYIINLWLNIVTDSISFWLCYEVKYSMLLRLKESGQVSDSAVHGSLNKLFC